MREILFRGKTIGSGEWVQGDLQIQAYPLAAIMLYDPCDGYGNLVPVDRNTVGQFTGMLDKNGVKIFEGDICVGFQGMNSQEGIVVFKKGMWNWNWNSNATSWLFEAISKFKMEVIGNIHEKGE